MTRQTFATLGIALFVLVGFMAHSQANNELWPILDDVTIHY